MSTFLVYAVRNREGKWFRAKGYGGYGPSWVDNLEKAKIYPSIGPARSRVSYFANHHPHFGIPELVVLSVTQVEVIDETKRVEDQRAKKATAKANLIKNQAKRRLAQAQKDLIEAQRRLNAAKQAK